MENPYHNSVIYTIEHNENTTLLYVGSTKDFEQRIKLHKQKCKTYNSKVYKTIRDNGGWNCFTMKIYKQFKCNTKREMFIEEELMRVELGATLNEKRAYVSEEERIEQSNIKKQMTQERLKREKQFREEHKDEIKLNKAKYNKEWTQNNKERRQLQQKEWREKNKEKNKEQSKEWYKKNIERAKEYEKQYRKDNADKIKQRKREFVLCECGKNVRKDNKAQHKRSNVHKRLMTP